jgi:hypothetical protein
MKQYFVPLSLFSLVFALLKMAFSVFSLINPLPFSSFLFHAFGVNSLFDSASMAENMSTRVTPFLWGFLITSALVAISVLLMRRKMRMGFYLYFLVNVFLMLFFFYAGFNLFPGFEYVAVLPLLGILLYISMLDYFWFKKS